MELEKQLIRLRREHGLSQDTLAKELGVTRQAVSKWERGLVIPSSENLIALSRLYQLPAERFFEEAGLGETKPDLEERKEEAQPGAEKKEETRRSQWIRSGVVLAACIVICALLLGWIRNMEATIGAWLLLAGIAAACAGLIYFFYQVIQYLKNNNKKGSDHYEQKRK